jgi:hypothetical protein
VRKLQFCRSGKVTSAERAAPQRAEETRIEILGGVRRASGAFGQPSPDRFA